jgi:hypothetical protein
MHCQEQCVDLASVVAMNRMNRWRGAVGSELLSAGRWRRFRYSKGSSKNGMRFKSRQVSTYGKDSARDEVDVCATASLTSLSSLLLARLKYLCGVL